MSIGKTMLIFLQKQMVFSQPLMADAIKLMSERKQGDDALKAKNFMKFRKIRNGISWANTHKNYDFMGIVQNDSDKDQTITFLEIEGNEVPEITVPAKSWIGILNNYEGTLQMAALEHGLIK